MQITENQTISADNLLNYRTMIKKSEILKLIKYITNHLYILDLQKNGNIIFTLVSDISNEAEFEIFVPVLGEVMKCEEFDYLPELSLEHAVSARHEGSLADLQKVVSLLKKYLEKNNYSPATRMYYVVIREGDDTETNCIIDIYVGIDKHNSDNNAARENLKS